MKLVNNTRYDTAHLRAFVSRIAKLELPPQIRFRLRVTCLPSRKYFGGTAYIRTAQIKLHIPPRNRDDDMGHKDDRLKLAALIAHEMAHLRTKASGRAEELWMRSCGRYGCHEQRMTDKAVAERLQRYAWALMMPLERAAEKQAEPIAPDAKAAAKLEHVELLQRRWEAKAKRAATAIKKYKRKAAYYRKKLASAASVTKGE